MTQVPPRKAIDTLAKGTLDQPRVVSRLELRSALALLFAGDRLARGCDRHTRNSPVTRTMNVDHILRTLNESQVDYVLIGGMNFLIRHLPELTFDVDIWVQDTVENRTRLNRCLRLLGAAWGRTEAEWRPVSDDPRWLESQGVFC